MTNFNQSRMYFWHYGKHACLFSFQYWDQNLNSALISVSLTWRKSLTLSIPSLLKFDLKWVLSCSECVGTVTASCSQRSIRELGSKLLPHPRGTLLCSCTCFRCARVSRLIKLHTFPLTFWHFTDQTNFLKTDLLIGNIYWQMWCINNKNTSVQGKKNEFIFWPLLTETLQRISNATCHVLHLCLCVTLMSHEALASNWNCQHSTVEEWYVEGKQEQREEGGKRSASESRRVRQSERRRGYGRSKKVK